MPEILEIEVYRVLAERVVGRTVRQVQAPDAWFVKGGATPAAVADALVGRRVTAARRRGKLLITKRPLDVMLGGLWEFPGGKRRRGESLEAALRREVREETGLDVQVGEHAVSVKHAYSHFRVTLHAFWCACPRGRVRPVKCDAFKWVRPDDLAGYPFPAGSVRIIEALPQVRP